MSKRFFAILLAITGCGGVVAETDAGPDAGLDATNKPEASIVDGGCVGVDGSCWVVPLACCSPPKITLSEALAPFAGLKPTDPCPNGTTWTERYDACNLSAIHGFAGPPTTQWFDTTSGALVGTSTSSDTGCSGCGTIDFPCDAIVQCTHLCGAVTSTIEPPHCPPTLDAGGD
jgi:hypothetical protein